MTQGADLARLRENRDMLANVDAHGTPVATARFMGGREYEAIAGNSCTATCPTLDSLRSVLECQVLALPSFFKAGGPFTGRNGKLLLNDLERRAAATLYCALQTALLPD